MNVSEAINPSGVCHGQKPVTAAKLVLVKSVVEASFVAQTFSKYTYLIHTDGWIDFNMITLGHEYK